MPDFLTLKEASKHTGYNQDYIGQLVRAEKIKAKRVGKSWLVDRGSLVSYLNSLGKTPRDKELLLPSATKKKMAASSLSIATLLFFAGALTTLFVLAGSLDLGQLYRFLPAGLRFADFTKQINYQGKLRSVSTNQAVPDDDYNLTFRLYQNLTGGSAIWTEPQTVTTRNGLFSAMLGSVTSLEGVNLNQPLYLSVQVSSDSEMSPRKLLGAVPASIVAEQLNGHFIDEFVLNNATSTVATSSTQTIFTIDQLGSGNIFELKKSGDSKITVVNDGSLTVYSTTTLATTTISSGSVNSLQIDNLGGLLQGTSGVVSAIATSSLGLLTTDVSEGSNLYWRIDRFASALAGTTTDALPEGDDNLYWSSSLFNSAFSGKDTDDLTQGSTNYYYSDSLVGNYLGASSTLVSSINYWTKTGNDLSYDLGSVGIDEGNYYKYNGDNLAYASTTLVNYFYGGAGNLTMTGINNNAFGSGALSSNTSGVYNSAFGHQSLYHNTTGQNNSAFGTTALFNNTSGNNNIAMGLSSLLFNNDGGANTAIGNSSMYSNTSGSNNVSLGMSSLYSNTTGDFNTALGVSTLFYASSSVRNTAVGFGAGTGNNGTDYNSITDSYMTFLGSESSRDNNISSTTPITKSTAIGYNAKVGGSNIMALGGVGADAVRVGIGTSTPSAFLTVVGDTYLEGNATTTGNFNVGADANALHVYEKDFGVFNGQEMSGDIYMPAFDLTFPGGGVGVNNRLIVSYNADDTLGDALGFGSPNIIMLGESGNNWSLEMGSDDILNFKPSVDAMGVLIADNAGSGGYLSVASYVGAGSNYTANIGNDSSYFGGYFSDPGGDNVYLAYNDGAGVGDYYAIHATGNSYFDGNATTTGNLVVSGTTTSSCFTIDGVTCITGGGGSSQWTTAGDDIYYETGKVSIGTDTSSASSTLTVQGGADFAPKLINSASVNLGDDADSIFILGNYAYVGSHGGTGTAVDQDFIIFDISDPYNPTAVGGVDFALSTAGTKAMFVRGKYAYMSNFNVDTYAPDEDFFVFDVSDPTNPTHVGSLNIPGLTNGPFDIDINGNYAYLVTQGTNNLNIIDISDPTNMSVLGVYGGNCNEFYGVKVYDDQYVFTSGELTCDGYVADQGVIVFDVSDPTSPTPVGGYNSGGALSDADLDIDIVGRYAYVLARASTTKEFQILDISSSTNPIYVNGTDLNTGLQYPSKLVVYGDYVFLGMDNGGPNNEDLLVYNISDPQNIYLADAVETGNSGNTHGLKVSGGYLYAVDSPTNYFSIYNIGGLKASGANIGSLFSQDLSVSGSAYLNGNLYSNGDIYSSHNIYGNNLYANEQYLNLNSITAFNPLGTSVGDTGQLIFKELTANGSDYVGFKAPDSIGSSQVWTLPNSDGNLNSFLTSDGAGNLSWGSSTIGSTAFLSEINIISTPDTAQTWSNMPAAETEFDKNIYTEKYANLTNYTQFRLVATQVIVGFADAYLRVQYSTDDGSTWYNLEDASTGGDLDVTDIGAKSGAWATIDSSAKTEVLLRIMGYGGNGVSDPSWRQLSIQFKGYTGSQWTSEAGGNISYSDGFVGIGTTTPTHELSVVGDLRVGSTTNYWTTSELDLTGSDFGDLGYYSMLSAYSDGTFGNIGTIADSLSLYDTADDDLTSLNFVGNNVSSIGGIEYDNQTYTFTFDEVLGNANVHVTDGLQVDGNATTTGNYYIGGDLAVTGTTTSSCFTTDGVTCIGGSSLPSGIDGQVLSYSSSGWLATSSLVIATSTGNVGIGVTSPSSALSVSGDVDITGTYMINGQSVFSTDPYNYYAGYLAGNVENNLSSSTMNVAIGSHALSNNLEVFGSVAIGYQALLNSTSSSYNTAIGWQALKANLTGDNNLALGVGALLSNTIGYANVALGNLSLENNTSGSSNIAIGAYSLWSNQNSSYNVAIGKDSLKYNQSGIGNVAVGWRSLLNNLSNYNSVFGNNALEGNTSGDFNVAFGHRAGYDLGLENASLLDDYMVFIGADATRDGSIVASTTKLTNAIAIGYNAKVGGSNMMALGGLGVNAVNVGIGTSTPNYNLVVGSGSTTAGVKSIQVPYGSICVDSDGECTPAVAGTIYAVNYSTGNSDLAENYPIYESDIKAGYIVSAADSNTTGLGYNSTFGVIKARTGQNPLGVVSTKPGVTLGLDNDLGSQGQVPVALSGRVPVKVNLEGGNINAGDYIILSSVPGIGTKATTSGQTIGIALESFTDSSTKDNEGIGEVLVFVNLNYARLDNQISLGDLNSDNFWQFDDITGQLKAFGTLDLNNFDLTNVRSITSASGNWSIGEDGTLVVKNIRAENAIIENGVTVRDQGTGEYSCIYVENGQIKNKEGECQSQESEDLVSDGDNSSGSSNSESDPVDQTSSSTEPIVIEADPDPAPSPEGPIEPNPVPSEPEPDPVVLDPEPAPEPDPIAESEPESVPAPDPVPPPVSE
jgi:hypothetical protein